MVDEKLREAFMKHNENYAKEYDCVIVSKEDAEKLKTVKEEPKTSFFDRFSKEEKTTPQVVQPLYSPPTNSPNPVNPPVVVNNNNEKRTNIWYIIVITSVLFLAAIIILVSAMGWNKDEINCPVPPACNCPAAPACNCPMCPSSNFTCGNVTVDFPSTLNLKINMTNGTI